MTRRPILGVAAAKQLLVAWPALLFIALPVTAAAQEPRDTIELSEIVVTATRLPTPLRAVPAAVSVITGDELRARGIRFVADALRTVPGAHLAGGGATGAITSLFLRGGESDYALVLVDGVPVNEPGGAFDFAHLSTHDIDRIEIVRGPVSVLYGTDAVAGVVQIFTRRGGTEPRLSAALEAGRYAQLGSAAGGRADALAYDVGLTGEAGRFRYGFGAARYGTDGLLAVNSDYENRSASARFGWTAPLPAARGAATPARSDMGATIRWTDHRYHFPTDGAGRFIDLNQYSTGRSWTTAVEAGHFVTPRLEARAAVRMHEHETGFDDRPDSPADTLGFYAAESRGRTLRRGVDARANVHGARHVLTFGAAAEWQQGRSRYSSESEFGPFESASDDDRSSVAAFAQLLATPFEPLALTAGGRFDRSATFGDFATYRLGANVRVLRAATLRASFATGFKEPTFYENFATGIVQGNPDLAPERTRAAELGALVATPIGVFGITAYRQRFRDMIQYDARPRDQRAGDANYFNLGAAAADGIELELDARIGRRSDLRAGYNYLNTEVLDAGVGADRAFAAGQRLLRRPAHSGSIVASHRLSAKVGVSATVRRVGARDDLDFADDWQGERTTLPGFTTLGASLQLVALRSARTGDLAITLRADNLLDAGYEDIRNFPARGRALFVGVRM
jgi:vitamin B12 transporter